ncbi:hypothetical protein T439DRAFT_356591 [Meredithblackwellia eburnea MCA 4105]
MVRLIVVVSSILSLTSFTTAVNVASERKFDMKRSAEAVPGAVGSIPFGYSGMMKRQTGAQPVVDIGTSNPIAPASDISNVGIVDAVKGSANGAMSPFNKRQTGAQAEVKTGTSNPEATDLNELGDSDATSGSADGSITPIGKMRRSPAPHELNLVSHNRATRGYPDGRIEEI